jgi:hypothetical protein
MAEFSPYQTDVLFLLIGANPLPNYVSALLLAKMRGTVYLLHTDATLKVAERLSEQIQQGRSDLVLVPWEISKSDPQLIEQQLKRLTGKLGSNADVGLNYTGGSKPMAVQAYHTLRASYPRGIFSYLDADTLSLMIEAPGLPTQQVFVGHDVKVDFETLFALHGYEMDAKQSSVIPLALRQALVEVNSAKKGYDEWRAWLQTLAGDDPQLPTLASYPALAPAIEALQALCGDDPPTPALVAMQLGCKNGRLASCTKLLVAEWLEEYVYEVLQALAPGLGLHQVSMGLEPKPAPNKPKDEKRNMELDAAALLGYQLFAVSCMVTDRAQSAKDHLMEAFVRARQLGGDEARFALVCCLEKPDMMEKEVNQGWGAEDIIRVFGREHLPDLAHHFREWITSAGQIQ